ncbi:class I adenylate-forming enzyme family protein [Novosphingobium sp. JCM 18896]|uniref:class I adenylate-forming enzyme family protein n=1 Tax=Novosphingobium sp. JCM 18896 TaxID=2989731 RepID=UPI0022216BFD|nr:class I adenylate-forming enzyme family protein [Novosphingobium sp. JCM 18896]MCW1428343.1 acyl--CoA ligase [Novosphingobium sp. JCM 18896]
MSNIRDPLVARLIGPGKAFELVPERIGDQVHEVFRGAPRNLAGLYRQGMQYGDRLMIVHGDTRLTYAEGFARAAALAQTLRERYSVGQGTTVAVVTANRPEWIISLLAITALGGVAALVNSRGAAEEMLRAIDKVGCTLAILDAERDDVITAEQPDPAWPRIVIGEPKVPLRARDADFAALSAPQPGLDFAPADIAPGQGAIILFTSGTTGFPKGALLSHGALAHSVSVAAFMGTLQDIRYEEESGETLPPDRRAMTTPAVILGPMFHLSGIMPILRALSLGTTIHIMGKWNADVAFDMIEHVGMTRLSFVPAMLFDMFRSPRATPEMLANVRYMVNGAAPLNLALVEEIKARMPNCQLANGYGQTEATAQTCNISGNLYLDHPAACGWAAPTVKIELRRDDGSIAAPGEAGELWVSSPMLMNEYVGDPEATAETLQDGWLASGDVATVDENGIYTIVDRKKNMIISGGENIYCAEVERVVGDHPAVREVIAYGLPDARLGERLAVTAVLEAGAEASEDEIKAHAKQRVAIYKVPRDVFLTRDSLPRTASGKVDRGKFLKTLRELA